MSFLLENPYPSEARERLRGNLHTHTTLSDGVLAPEEVIAEYERRGYDFLALTDHDLYVPVEPYQATTSLLLLAGVEVGKGPHLLALGLEEMPPLEENHQAMIEAVRRAGGWVVLNHPNWGKRQFHWSLEALEALEGYVGIEIYNGVIERLEGSALATDRWDQLWSLGRRVWGFATDDAHALKDVGRGWVVAWVAERSAATLQQALRQGAFYASTGVDWERLEWDGKAFLARAMRAGRVRALAQWGREVASTWGRELVYRPSGQEGYLRFEAFGDGGQMAWSQPIALRQGA